MKAGIIAEYSILIGWVTSAILVVSFLPGSVYSVAIFSFGAVIAASLLIAWAAEASESSISRGLALAIVAIVQTIPEYFVEGTIAWKAGQDPVVWLPNVVANFTGANRLLTGLGWPLILFTLIIQRKRRGVVGPTTIALGRGHSVEVVFMIGGSLYYVWILVERALTLIDSIILTGIFVAYMWMLAKMPRGMEEAGQALEGAPLAIVQIRSPRRRFLLIVFLFAFSGMTFYLISGPFVESIRQIAEMFLVGLLGSGAVFFSIQWIAPVLSEFPEKVTAFNWARQIRLAPMALLNFISSAVNELTALVALIPILFITSKGSLGVIPLDGQQWIEVFLTMAQSLYACITLLDLEYDISNAMVLFSLWLISTALIEARLVVSIIFLLLAAIELVGKRRRIVVFSAFRRTVGQMRQGSS
ncbi:MAG TPA: hypothetical protein VFE98_01195 [Candidatus Bathyarchaeia archaeon]|nr:hypothetical protein [Candidatus Bathyarchaeia archaeon]